MGKRSSSKARIEPVKLIAPLQIGDRVFNAGDIANQAHFCTVTETHTDQWGTSLKVLPDDEHNAWEGRSYWIEAICISAIYSGNGSTRFCTEAEYLRYRKAIVAQMQQEEVFRTRLWVKRSEVKSDRAALERNEFCGESPLSDVTRERLEWHILTNEQMIAQMTEAS